MKHFCSIVLLLCTLSIYPQDSCSISLQGKVIDQHKSVALSDAHVFIQEINKGQIADSLGYFQFDNLCPGTYTLICSHLGCSPVKKTIQLIKNKTISIYLVHHIEDIENTTILGHKSQDNIYPVSSISANSIQAESNPSLAGKIKNLPGITNLITGATINKPVINGFHSNRIIIVHNGLPLYSQNWGSEHAPEIAAANQKSISIQRSGSAMRFGPGGFGGTIEVTSQDLPDSVGIVGNLQASGASNGRYGAIGGYLATKFSNQFDVRLKIYGNLEKAGNYSAPNYALPGTGFSNQNMGSEMEYHHKKGKISVHYDLIQSELGIYSLSHIGNLTDFNAILLDTLPRDTHHFTYFITNPYQKILHETVSATASYEVGSSSTLKVLYGRQFNNRKEFDVHHSDSEDEHQHELHDEEPEEPALDLKLTSHYAELMLERDKNRWKSQTAITGLYQKNTFRGRFFIPNYLQYNYSAFHRQQFQLKKLHFQLELRYDFINRDAYLRDESTDSISEISFTYDRVGASFGLNHKLGKNVQQTLNIHHNYRPPSPNELFAGGLHHGAAAFEKGNQNLNMEKMYGAQYNLGLHFGTLSISSELLYNYFDNYIYLQPDADPVLSIQGAFPSFSYNQIRAEYFGCNVYSTIQLNQSFKLQASYSLIRAQEFNTKTPLLGIPSDRYRASIRYEFSKNPFLDEPFIQLRFIHVAKQYLTGDLEVFSKPPDAYSLFNLQLGSKIPLANTHIIWTLSCNNLLNTTYREYMNRFRYYADSPGRNIHLQISLPFEWQKKN